MKKTIFSLYELRKVQLKSLQIKIRRFLFNPQFGKMLFFYIVVSLYPTHLTHADILDLNAPDIDHEVSDDYLGDRSFITIDAKVTDNLGVKLVTLFYRLKGETIYKSLDMHRVKRSNIYKAILQQDGVDDPGVEYYIKATDITGNSTLRGYADSPIFVQAATALHEDIGENITKLLSGSLSRNMKFLNAGQNLALPALILGFVIIVLIYRYRLKLVPEYTHYTGHVEEKNINKAAPNNTAKNKIFMSYRRFDSADVSGRIYDRLIRHFGPESTFKDVDSIPLGIDYRKYIDEVISSSSVLLVVIGPNWVDTLDKNGKTRLENDNDYVRIEILAALKRNILIVPLLVGGANMPSVNLLPDDLCDIAYRHCINIRPDPDFNTDTNRLIKGIQLELTRCQQNLEQNTDFANIG